MTGDVHPCRRLLAAVLIQAVNDAHGRGVGHGNTVQHRARTWLASDDTGERSFVWYCELMGLDPEPLRAGALYGPRRRRGGVSKVVA
jgi:hypothetical protein